jgi:hypothetical protein
MTRAVKILAVPPPEAYFDAIFDLSMTGGGSRSHILPRI